MRKSMELESFNDYFPLILRRISWHFEGKGNSFSAIFFSTVSDEPKMKEKEQLLEVKRDLQEFYHY